MSALDRWRDAAVRRMLGIDIRRMNADLERVEDRLAEIAGGQDRVGLLERRGEAVTEALRRLRDGTVDRIADLEGLRSSPLYEAIFDEPEPLISVRIASYCKTDELIDVAIASVLGQSYRRFEIIVVNDGPNPTTKRAIELLGDPRIHYHELSERSVYPEDSHHRWMVAGSPGMNRAADLSRGAWLAPLDDDDEFTADHLEKLLHLARECRAELAYGALVQRNLVNATEARIWSSPPAVSQFSFQGSIYLRPLHSIFRYDESSWLVEEPGDWNLVRRMCAAGVIVAGTPDVVAFMNQVPYTHKASE